METLVVDGCTIYVCVYIYIYLYVKACTCFKPGNASTSTLLVQVLCGAV